MLLAPIVSSVLLVHRLRFVYNREVRKSAFTSVMIIIEPTYTYQYPCVDYQIIDNSCSGNTLVSFDIHEFD